MPSRSRCLLHAVPWSVRALLSQACPAPKTLDNARCMATIDARMRTILVARERLQRLRHLRVCLQLVEQHTVQAHLQLVAAFAERYNLYKKQ